MSLENETKLSPVLRSAQSFYSEKHRAMQLNLEAMNKHTNHTPDSQAIVQKVIAAYGTPEQAIQRYKEAIQSQMSIQEINSLAEINSNPVVEKFNELSQYNPEAYLEFSKNFNLSESKHRDELIEEFVEKNNHVEHSMNLNDAFMTLIGKPELSNNAQVADQMRVQFKQASKMGLHVKLQDFTDAELKELVQLKTKPVALKEESIKQKVLEEQIRDPQNRE